MILKGGHRFTAQIMLDRKPIRFAQACSPTKAREA